MSTGRSFTKQVLVTAIESLIALLEESKWVKVSGALVSGLVKCVPDLSEEHAAALSQANAQDIEDAISQLDLVSKNAAFTAAGIVRVEEQVSVLRTAIELANAQVRKAPRTRVSQRIAGRGHVVAGTGDIYVHNIDMRSTNKRSRAPIIPGTVATDPQKSAYLRYLADRYNHFKEAEVGKRGMKYALIHVTYKREMRCTILNTPLDLFDQAAAWLQRRISNTIVGRVKGRQGNRLFSTFDEFCRGREKSVATS